MHKTPSNFLITGGGGDGVFFFLLLPTRKAPCLSAYLSAALSSILLAVQLTALVVHALRKLSSALRSSLLFSLVALDVAVYALSYFRHFYLLQISLPSLVLTSFN